MSLDDVLGAVGATPTPQPKPEPQPGPKPLSLDDVLSLDQDHDALAAATSAGLEKDPARAAKLIALQARTGLPTDLIDRNYDQVLSAARQRDFDPDAFRKQSPVVAQWLSEDPARVGLTRDDLPALAAVEALVRSSPSYSYRPDGSIVETFPDSGYANVYSDARGLRDELARRGVALDEARYRQQQVEDQLNDLGPLSGIGAGVLLSAGRTLAAGHALTGFDNSATEEGVQQTAAASDVVDPGVAGTLARFVGQQVADAPLLMAGGAMARLAQGVTKAASVGKTLAPLLGKEGAKAVGKALASDVAQHAVAGAGAMQPFAVRDALADDNGTGHALASWAIDSGIAGAFGPVGVGRAAAKAAGAAIGPLDPTAGALAVWLKHIGLAGGQNLSFDLAHRMHDYASGVDPTALDWHNLLPSLATSGALGALPGAVFGAPEAIERARTIAETAGQVQVNRMGAALSTADRLAGIADTLNDTQAAKLNQDATGDLLSRLAQNTGIRTLYIDAKAWQKQFGPEVAAPGASGTDRSLAAQATGDPMAYDKALSSNGMLALPIDKFVPLLAKPEYRDFLLAEAREAPEAMNKREAQEMAQAVAERAAIQAEAAGPDSPEAKRLASADLVHADVKRQLLAAGSDDSAATRGADIWRSVMHTASARGWVQTDPFDTYQGMKLRIQRGMSTGVVRSTLDALIERLKAGDIPTDQDIERAKAPAGGPVETPTLDAIREIGGIAKTKTAESDDRPKGVRGIDGTLPPDQAAKALAEQGIGDGTVNTMWSLVAKEHAARTGADTSRQDTEDSARIRQIRDALMEIRDHLHAIGADVAKEPTESLKQKLLAMPQDRGQALAQTTDGHPIVVADVPYGGGTSSDGRTVYMDRRIPQFLDIGGKRVDVWQAIAQHETFEKRRMDAGDDYATAHEAATANEHAYVSDTYGIDPAEYEKALKPYLDAAEREAKPEGTPSDLERMPYEAEGDAGRVDQATGPAFQQGAAKDPRGTFLPSRLSASGENVITLLKGADKSTFLHETGHALLEFMHDLAGRADAPQALKDDLARIRDWLGAKDDDALTRSQHEDFARGFEKYLMNGTAPSRGLLAAFRRFKNWLLEIYRNGDALRVHLPDEVKAVFDRMLATDDEIADARREAGADPLFADQAESGMNAQQWATYQARVQEGKERAREILLREAMAPLKAEATKAYQEQRERTKRQVADEVNQSPAYRALLVLQRGAWPDGVEIPEGAERVKLSRDDLVSHVGEAGLKLLPGPDVDGSPKENRGQRIYSTEGGMRLDDAAELFGFRDGGDLVQALMSAPDRIAEIERRTDERMRETHPDPLLDGSLHEKARIAVDNDARLEVMAREAAALALKSGRVATPSDLLRAVARAQIEKVRVADLRPSLYRVARDRAVRSAAEAAAKAKTATDPTEKAKLAAEALDHKTNEILQSHLYREATEAKERSERNRTYVQSWDDPEKRSRIGKAGGWEWAVVDPRAKVGDEPQSFSAADHDGDPDKAQAAAIAAAKKIPGSDVVRTGYLEQADAIREGLDLSPASNRALEAREGLRDFIARKTAAGEPIAIPQELLNLLGKKNWRELTVGQQQAVVDGLKNLQHLATVKSKLMANARAADFAQARDAQVAQMKATGKLRPDRGPGVFDKPLSIVKAWADGMLNVAHYCREMDDGKDGGVLFDHWQRPLNEAEGHEIELQERSTNAWLSLVKEWGKLSITKGGGIGLSVKRFEPAIGRSMTHWERIMVALNWGNADNRERLLKGHGWSESQVAAVMAKLDKADMRFVQGVLDHIDSFWPEIKAKQERVLGVAPEKVDATPIVHESGVYRGGYFPIAYDPETTGRAMDLSQQADLTKQGARLYASTARGHTEARTQMPAGAKLLLDPGVIVRHLNNVCHDLAYHETLLDLNRYLRDPELATTMRAYWGGKVFGEFRDSIAAVAAGSSTTRTGIEQMLTWLRTGVNFANRAFNIGSALQQVAGMPGSIVRVGTKYWAKALVGMFKNPYATDNVFRWVDESSPMMRGRTKTFDKNVADVMGGVSLRSPIRKIMDGAGYYLWTKAFQVLDTHTWLASYMKAMDEFGADEAKARAVADQTVIDVQGSGATKDLPPAMRGGALAQVFTSNMSWWLANYRLTAQAVNRGMRGDFQSVLKSGCDLFVLYGVQVAAWNALGAALTGKHASDWQNAFDDPGTLATTLAKDAAYTGLSSMVLVRDLADVITEGRGYEGPAGLRSMSLIAQAIQAIEKNRGDERELSSVAKAAGPLFHLPVAQIVSTAEGMAKAQEQGRSPLWAAMFGPDRK